MSLCEENKPLTPQETKKNTPDLEAWFAVSGDMDDFIFFGDTAKEHSEK